jgi:hypothetical protein
VILSAACGTGGSHIVGLGEHLGLYNVLSQVGLRTLVAPQWDIVAADVIPILSEIRTGLLNRTPSPIPSGRLFGKLSIEVSRVVGPRADHRRRLAMTPSLADELNTRTVDTDGVHQALRYYLAERLDDLPPEDMLETMYSAAGRDRVDAARVDLASIFRRG